MTMRLSPDYKAEFLAVWNGSSSVDEFLLKFPRSLSRQTALSIASRMRVDGDPVKNMDRNPRNTKDGRTSGHRLGWVSDAMYQRIAQYAAHRGISVNDATVELLDFALTDFEELADAPPAITDLFEVEQ